MELECVTVDGRDPVLVARSWNDALRIAGEEESSADVTASFRTVILRDPEGNELCLGGGALP